jgi:hypothetical protein
MKPAENGAPPGDEAGGARFDEMMMPVGAGEATLIAVSARVKSLVPPPRRASVGVADESP